MFLIFAVFLLVTTIPFIRVSKEGYEDYLSKDFTNAIKGVFLFLVFVRHFLQYNPGFADTFLNNCIKTFNSRSGQLIVVMFLFYSGYGIMESAKRKGKSYVKALPGKRILPTLINYDIAVIIFVIATGYFVTHVLNISNILKLAVGWNSAGNSNWYIFCILAMYVIAWASLSLFGVNNKSVVCVFFCAIAYALILHSLKDSWWYNTCLCFPLGMLYSIKREKIEAFLKKWDGPCFIVTALIFVLLWHFRSHWYIYLLLSMMFALLVVLVTRHVRINSPILKWGGLNLFPLFIFQRLPMILLKDTLASNGYFYFIACFGVTIVIGVLWAEIGKAKGRILQRVNV